MGELVGLKDALVCCEASGGQERKLWVASDAAGVTTRQLPPAQIRAHGTLGPAEMFAALDAELKDLLEHQIAGLETQI